LLLGTGLLAAFAATRLGLLWRFPPFTDEALYAQWAWQGYHVPDDRFISLASGKEPLLPWAAMGWIHLGVAPITAVRLVSVVAGAATVVLVGLIARELMGDRAAWAAAGLAVLLPFFVVHDVVGIYDTLAAALVAAALLLQLRLARRPTLGEALLLGLVFAAGALTKSTTQVAVALLPVGLLLLDWRPDGRLRRVGAWLGAVALALVLGALGASVLRLSEFYDDFRAAEGEITPVHGLGEGLRHLGTWVDRNLATDIDALVDTVVSRVLDQLGVANSLMKRWGDGSGAGGV